MRKRAGIDRAFLRAQTHRSAEVRSLVAPLDPPGAVEPLGNQRDDRMRGLRIKLGAVRAGEPADVARELDRGELHAEADAEVRNPVFARVADRPHLALGAAL